MGILGFFAALCVPVYDNPPGGLTLPFVSHVSLLSTLVSFAICFKLRIILDVFKNLGAVCVSVHTSPPSRLSFDLFLNE